MFKKLTPQNLRRLQRKAARFHARIHIRTGHYHLILPQYCTLSFHSFTALWIFVENLRPH
ncbi:hypothetical protein [Odoribacter sp. Z80]|uniref:hypothetical protein n=1 Tax=Odoribacter sp. Z80 TaxID=2304575 RepID=UPI001379B01D|nr:hypothetical protein [Odoribacter sp. Z80]